MEIAQENKVLQFVENLSVGSDLPTYRAMAKDALAGMDFPTTRVEDWKYTRVTRITKQNYKSVEATADASAYRIPALNANVMVFVNGFYDAAQSSIEAQEGVTISAVADMDLEDYLDKLDSIDENVFSLINKAYYTGGAFVRVEKKVVAAKPLHIIHITTGEGVIANTRHFIDVDQSAEMEVVCTHHSVNAAESFSNVVLEGSVGVNAGLKVHKLQLEELDMFHISTENFIQEKDARFDINTITLGGLLVRNGLNILVDGENCDTMLNGVYLTKEKQLVDNHTFVDHLQAHCVSDEMYKGVVDDKSKAVFNGKVIVREDSQKIEAFQANGNVLLSRDAEVNAKPELEIYADDVKCSHGCTIGQLDEDGIFYLRARGLGKKSAEQLMTQAFIGEVIERVKNETVQDYIYTQFEERFGWVR
ncbi:Iron-regulated ABC transporter permease protein SufD [Lishizhenia tianjinensis]|uniref:Iron-regulated ABC transporter permease protein SufD n=1 Tax=Lishizhenia tianjinensis TaxID=477690 RepID=A0A1I7AY38_9FLAO|nr:Fe-S cluster assembly protein SufD [Lishizhenia tianjinensis]SFT79802.1 Iron-regulated ABC transporter permease protein SufD [Lishizhenia tianjinensis]